MTIERARADIVPKPWGVVDLKPWGRGYRNDKPIGEIWYERSQKNSADSLLLLKLLFTSEPLSIQVHPDDAYAHSIGLPGGKSEAWYVLSATPDAKVAIGLKRQLTSQQLRDATLDGSISDIVAWQTVSADDVILVPAGTVHAIGAGLVIAEIQQRSDSTFRLFDYGRQRELHIDSAIAVATTGPAVCQAPTRRLTDERILLTSNPHFLFERINLAPNTAWHFESERETWLLVLSGSAGVGSFDVGLGDAIFMQADRAVIHSGTAGMAGLVAYTGSDPISRLLLRVSEPGTTASGRSTKARASVSLLGAKRIAAKRSSEILQ